tara:strand:- start:20 stop:361 length:342 start_codon:yes stop_codon:yes gene_type:complete
MGYRSQVYVGVPPTKSKKLESLKWKYETTSLENSETGSFEDLFKPIKIGSDGMNIYMGDWLKWYEGYKDVDAITNFVEESEGFIVCIGEDEAIHSATGEYYDYVDIRTEIDII